MLKKLLMLFVALSLSLTAAFAAAVEVNTADQAALESVKGLGPVKSKAIIDERTKNGPFKDADDLANRVKGLGTKSVAHLEENGLTIGGSATPPKGVKASKPAAVTGTTAPATKPAATPATTAPATTGRRDDHRARAGRKRAGSGVEAGQDQARIEEGQGRRGRRRIGAGRGCKRAGRRVVREGNEGFEKEGQERQGCLRRRGVGRLMRAACAAMRARLRSTGAAVAAPFH